MSPRCTFVSGRIGMSVAVAPRVILRRNTPRAAGCAPARPTFAVDVLAGHVDIDTFHGHRQQLAIVDFLCGADSNRLTSTSRRPATATTSPASITVSAVASMSCPSATDALDEHAVVGQQRLGFAHRLADSLPPCCNTEGAQLELVPGRPAGPTAFLLAAVLFLVALAAASRSMPSSAGPIRASTIAEPTVPKM